MSSEAASVLARWFPRPQHCEVCHEPQHYWDGSKLAAGTLGMRRYPDQLLKSAQEGCSTCKILREAIIGVVHDWETKREDDGSFALSYYISSASYESSVGPLLIIQETPTKKDEVRLQFISPESKPTRCFVAHVTKHVKIMHFLGLWSQKET
jgi:hypothetical protein